MDTSKAVTHVSLCAGYGGIDIGLKRAIPSLRTVAFSEIEGFACANLVAKMEAGLLDAAPIWTNLKTFPWAEFRGRVDILSGGYPCQPFSAAGKRLGTEDPRHLWPFIADGIRVMQPRVCFFENVEGHISLGLREVVGELESMGYKVSWGIFSAREVGAPHQRKRVFIMAHTADWGGQSLHDWNAKPTDAISCRSWPRRPGQRSAWEGCELGNAISERHEQNSRSLCKGQGETWIIASSVIADSSATAWPSRPGEPQHEWEPPRVVANTASERTVHGQQFRGEEWGQGRALPCESDESGDGMGDPIVHGHATSQISRGISKSKAEGGMQEFEGGSASVGNAEHDGSHGTAASRSNEANAGSRSKEESQVVEQCQGASGLGSEIRSIVGDTTEQRRQGSRGSHGEEWECIRPTQPNRSGGNWIMESKQRQAEPPLGGNLDGTASGLDYAKLCVSGDNRTDELRLLGNGVVPATATTAFLTLMEELKELK